MLRIARVTSARHSRALELDPLLHDLWFYYGIEVQHSWSPWGDLNSTGCDVSAVVGAEWIIIDPGLSNELVGDIEVILSNLVDAQYQGNVLVLAPNGAVSPYEGSMNVTIMRGETEDLCCEVARLISEAVTGKKQLTPRGALKAAEILRDWAAKPATAAILFHQLGLYQWQIDQLTAGTFGEE